MDQPYFSSKLSIVGRVKEKIALKYFQMNFYLKIKIKTVFDCDANANKNTFGRIICMRAHLRQGKLSRWGGSDGGVVDLVELKGATAQVGSTWITLM